MEASGTTKTTDDRYWRSFPPYEEAFDFENRPAAVMAALGVSVCSPHAGCRRLPCSRWRWYTHILPL
ncbi:MAG: hypothetical protein GX620_17910 [Chloroflexi bacterium]|nr:hypothetical protein [Chloroflexota bacterium]